MTGNQSGEGGGGDYQEAFKIKPAGHAAGYLVGFGGFSPPSPANQTKPNFLTNPKILNWSKGTMFPKKNCGYKSQLLRHFLWGNPQLG
jgi:hypothetical protein